MNCRGRTLAGVPLWGNEWARFHPNPRPTDTNSASLASRPHAQRLVGSALSGLVRCCSHQNLGCGGTHPPPRPNKRRVCVKMEKTKPCYSTGARRQLPPRQTRLAASTSIPLSLPPCASGRATALTPSGALFGGRAVARAMQPLPGSAQGTRSSRSPRDLFDSSSQGIHGVAWAWDDSPARSGAYGKGPAWRCPRQLDTDLSKVLSDELAFTRRDESWLRAEAHTGFEEPPSTRPVRPPPRTRLSGGRPHVWERDASALA